MVQTEVLLIHHQNNGHVVALVVKEIYKFLFNERRLDEVV